jgi:biotin carboxylase
VSVVRSASDLDEAVDTARRFSRSGKVLVERLLAGTEVIVDGIVLDGEPTVLGISSKSPNAENPTVSTSIAYPADLAPSALDLVRVTNRKALNALGLKRGPFHAEYFVTLDAVIPIDIAARGGGVHIYRLVIPHVSGFDLPVAAVRLALGEKVQLTACARSRAAVVEFLQAPPGVIRRIHGVADAESLPGIAVVYLRVAPGDVIRRLCDKDARPGHLVAIAESLSEARERAALARELIRFDVDPTGHQATKE